MDDDNYAIMLDSYVSTSKYQEVTRYWPFGFFEKMGDFTWESNEYDPSDLRQMIVSYGTKDYRIMCTVIHYLPLQCLREATGVYRPLPLILVGHTVPNEAKSEAYKALSHLFQQDWVPSTVIYNNTKKIILREFNRKLKEASSHLKQMEQFTPWLNAAKREIKNWR